MLMALGTFVFSLSTAAYQQLERSTAWRHAASSRVGARAAHQYLGPGEETVELSGIVAPDLTGTIASLAMLRELADEGRPLALVSGAGTVLGAYRITGQRETETLHYQDGTPRRIEFQLSLLRTDDNSEDDA